MSRTLPSALLIILLVALSAALYEIHSLSSRMDQVSQKVSDVAWSLAALSMTLGDSLETLQEDTQAMKESLQAAEARDAWATFELCLAQAETIRLGRVLAPGQYPQEPIQCIPPLPELELKLP